MRRAPWSPTHPLDVWVRSPFGVPAERGSRH
ncbi:hypothetical protein BN12_1900007 [Nostocoides japonicum T1-X7]|uniref:Uncharacterized protein n=1 Tax=Nostocoides japonicum T1-X7 TaxID=1194083 RepID=A0A077LZJ4_9MICO|nr:hypothetical protein BN12_1900007 [Tetrasphaera japonica T1-X7]